MGARGPKSGAELSVVSVEPRIGRPLPPEYLTEDQQEEWRAVVARMPPNWFQREAQGTLEAYCRHVIRQRFLAAELDRFEAEWLREDGGPDRYNKLAAMAERETRAILACARSLRISNQSRYDPLTAGRQSRGDSGRKRPWDFDPEAESEMKS